MVYTDILISLRKVIRSINLENKQTEKKFGVSTPQILILKFLNEQEEYQSTSKELKNLLNLNASTITGIISRLEKKQLIARLPSLKDKRIVKISLTLEGINLVNRLPSVLHEKFSLRLASLDPDQIIKIKEGIDILVDLLDAKDTDASPILSTEKNLDEEI